VPRSPEVRRPHCSHAGAEECLVRNCRSGLSGQCWQALRLQNQPPVSAGFRRVNLPRPGVSIARNANLPSHNRLLYGRRSSGRASWRTDVAPKATHAALVSVRSSVRTNDGFSRSASGKARPCTAPPSVRIRGQAGRSAASPGRQVATNSSPAVIPSRTQGRRPSTTASPARPASAVG
jgi:hypothetical protein